MATVKDELIKERDRSVEILDALELYIRTNAYKGLSVLERDAVMHKHNGIKLYIMGLCTEIGIK